MKTFQRSFVKSVDYAIVDRELNKVAEITSDTIVKTKKAADEILTKLNLDAKKGYTLVPLKINEEIRVITEKDFLEHSVTVEEFNGQKKHRMKQDDTEQKPDNKKSSK